MSEFDDIVKEITATQEGLGLRSTDKVENRRIKLAIMRYVKRYGKQPATKDDMVHFLAAEAARKLKLRKQRLAKSKLPKVTKAKAKRAPRKAAAKKDEKKDDKKTDIKTAPPTASAMPSLPSATSAIAAAVNSGTAEEKVRAIRNLYNPALITAPPPKPDSKTDSKGSDGRESKGQSEADVPRIAGPPQTPHKPVPAIMPPTPATPQKPDHKGADVDDITDEVDGLRSGKKKDYLDILMNLRTAAERKKWDYSQLYHELKDDYKGRTHLVPATIAARWTEFRKKEKYTKWLDAEIPELRREALKAVNEKYKKEGSGETPDRKDITSNTQLEEMMKDVPGFQGVIARNQPLKITKPKNSQGQASWIMNLDPLGKPGSHWCAILQSASSLEFFNSLGDDIPRDIISAMLKLPGSQNQKFKENALQTQSKDTSNCGYHAMQFIRKRATMPFTEATGFSAAEKDQSAKGEAELKQWREQFPAFKIVGGFAVTGPSNDLMDHLDDREVTNVTVERAPIASAITGMFKLLTKGKFAEAMKKNNYDTLFHLSLVLDLSDGSKVILQKNETVQMTRYTARPDTEAKPAGQPSCTLAEFVQHAVDTQGQSFWVHDGGFNNCQTMVMSCLQGNQLLTPELEAFVQQNVADIMRSFPPWLQALAKRVTSLAAGFRTIIDKFFK